MYHRLLAILNHKISIIEAWIHFNLTFPRENSSICIKLHYNGNSVCFIILIYVNLSARPLFFDERYLRFVEYTVWTSTVLFLLTFQMLLKS